VIAGLVLQGLVLARATPDDREPIPVL
jgi:hypothetical protein